MSSCLYDLPGPTANDTHGGHLVYGIPDDVSFFPNWNGGATDFVCWTDNSNVETGFTVDLWKYVNGWQPQHAHSVAPNSAGGWTCFSEEISGELGPGTYLYRVYVGNSYPNGVTGSQFGGFTEAGIQ